MPDNAPPARRVLLVDDDAMIVKALTRLLRQRGWLVSQAATVAAAHAELARAMPDLLIVDLFLGEDFGLEVVAAARQRDKDVKIIVLTGEPSPHNASLAMRAGATVVVSKLERLDDVIAAGELAPDARPRRGGGPGLASLEVVSDLHMLRMLERCAGSLRRAAQVLEISASTLKRRLSRLGWRRAG
ncbi:MAG: response regulator [Deltaproteobacteria bacterium]|nr:response regulator [Deltaproteobacteria bacterium]